MLDDSPLPLVLVVQFSKRLAQLRKKHGLTQKALAVTAGVHLSQYRRYESGLSQPTLEVIRNLAKGLNVSADALVFDEDERNPPEDLRMYFEALQQLNDDDRRTVLSVIEGLAVKREALRWKGIAKAG
jgi:transcriptional regulator with XRE-family HTH domain